MRQYICIHVGQAGVQIGESVWKQLLTEQGIQGDSKLENPDFLNSSINSFFEEKNNFCYQPRCLFIDLDPIVIEELQKKAKYLTPFNFIKGKEDSGNICSRAYYSIGKYYADVIQDRIQKLVEKCENLEGFLLFSSLGGGTGSGIGRLVLNSLQKNYPKKIKFAEHIIPSQKYQSSVVENYNFVLSSGTFLELEDLNVMMDNESLYNIGTKKLDIDTPTYSNLNALVAQITSSITSSIRFNGSLNCNLAEILNNLVPYPRIHHLITSFAPLLASSSFSYMSTQEMVRKIFQNDNIFLTIDYKKSCLYYMTSCLQFQGDFSPSEIASAITNIQTGKSIKISDWCPFPFKVGLSGQSPTIMPDSEIAKTNRSLCALSNSSFIQQKIGEISNKFDLMFVKRAFVHWFVGEGMEDDEFQEQRENLAALEKDYEFGYIEDDLEDGYESEMIE